MTEFLSHTIIKLLSEDIFGWKGFVNVDKSALCIVCIAYFTNSLRIVLRERNLLWLKMKVSIRFGKNILSYHNDFPIISQQSMFSPVIRDNSVITSVIYFIFNDFEVRQFFVCL